MRRTLCCLLLLMSSSPASAQAFGDPAGPDTATYSLAFKCGDRQYQIVYTAGTSGDVRLERAQASSGADVVDSLAAAGSTFDRLAEIDHIAPQCDRNYAYLNISGVQKTRRRAGGPDAHGSPLHLRAYFDGLKWGGELGR